MVKRLVMEMNMILCLFTLLLVTSGSCGSYLRRFASQADVIRLQGRLFINGPEDYSRAERGVPTSFKTGLEWENLKGNMTNDWKMGRNFSDNFTVDRGGCLANFRGTQTNCRRIGAKIQCYLDAVTYQDDVMIYIGYSFHGTASVRFSFRGRPNLRSINYHNEDNSRGTMQILPVDQFLPRNVFMDFTFYMIGCKDPQCYIDEDRIAILSYQAMYTPRGCRAY